jgi:hypothetical protein
MELSCKGRDLKFVVLEVINKNSPKGVSQSKYSIA